MAYAADTDPRMIMHAAATIRTVPLSIPKRLELALPVAWARVPLVKEDLADAFVLLPL